LIIATDFDFSDVPSMRPGHTLMSWDDQGQTDCARSQINVAAANSVKSGTNPVMQQPMRGARFFFGRAASKLHSTTPDYIPISP
jgi:hypothetical protein